MQTQKIIEQLGYKAKEAKVYLAALSLGECHVTDIAQKLKMPRSSVQIIVDRLHADGLMSFYVMRRYKYWNATNPEKILANLTKREEIIREALPRLTAIKKSSQAKKKATCEYPGVDLLRVFADSSSRPILIANENIEIEYVNFAWQNEFGYSLDEIKGKNPSLLKSGKTPIFIYKEMWEKFKKEKMFQTDQLIDKRKDGTLVNLLSTFFSIQYNGFIFYIQILDSATE